MNFLCIWSRHNFRHWYTLLFDWLGTKLHSLHLLDCHHYTLRGNELDGLHWNTDCLIDCWDTRVCSILLALKWYFSRAVFPLHRNQHPLCGQQSFELANIAYQFELETAICHARLKRGELKYIHVSCWNLAILSPALRKYLSPTEWYQSGYHKGPVPSMGWNVTWK